MSEHFRKLFPRPTHAREIRFRTSFHNTVFDVLKARAWRECEDNQDWDIFWCDKEWIYETFDTVHLQPHQKVNHFRNHYELTRKDLLVKNLKRAKRQAEKDGNTDEYNRLNMFPPTFVLPIEYSLFVEEFKKTHAEKEKGEKCIWIMKPCGKAQGKGIFLVSKLSEISDWKSETRFKPDNPSVESYVCQRYITNPLLVGGKKFDLRIYVLVTSYAPLTVYIYRSGFARFSHTRYNMDTADLTNMQMHLTNVAVQKHNENYDDTIGGKWDLQRMKTYFVQKHGEEKVNELFMKMTNIVIASCAACSKTIINDKHCFELYGYDIIIDENLIPWLLEVNASPSLTANTPTDYDLKFGLLDDTFSVLDFEKYFDGRPLEPRIGGFDLVYHNGYVAPPANCMWQSFLGSHNNRCEQMRRLARAMANKPKEAPPEEKEKKDNKKEDSPAKVRRPRPRDVLNST